MEKLVELDSNNNLTIHPEALGVKAYADLWNRDKSKTKSNALKELLFVWYMCSKDKINPFKEYPSDERIKRVIADVFDKEWKPDQIVLAAKEQFIRNNYTFNVEYLNSAIDASRKTKDFFSEVDYNVTNANGVYKYKVKEVIAALKETSSVIKELQSLSDLVESEASNGGRDNRIRGEGRVGGFER